MCLGAFRTVQQPDSRVGKRQLHALCITGILRVQKRALNSRMYSRNSEVFRCDIMTLLASVWPLGDWTIKNCLARLLLHRRPHGASFQGHET